MPYKEPSSELKKVILRDELERANGSIYHRKVSVEVARILGNEEKAKEIEAEMAAWIKVVNYCESEIAKIG